MDIYQRATAPTSSPGDAWLDLSDDERTDLVSKIIGQQETFSKLVDLVNTKDDGQVILSFLDKVSVNDRGGILLDIEDALKREVDPGLTVWLESLGDKSSLRRLRGIEVK